MTIGRCGAPLHAVGGARRGSIAVGGRVGLQPLARARVQLAQLAEGVEVGVVSPDTGSLYLAGSPVIAHRLSPPPKASPTGAPSRVATATSSFDSLIAAAPTLAVGRRVVGLLRRAAEPQIDRRRRRAAARRRGRVGVDAARVGVVGGRRERQLLLGGRGADADQLLRRLAARRRRPLVVRKEDVRDLGAAQVVGRHQLARVAASAGSGRPLAAQPLRRRGEGGRAQTRPSSSCATRRCTWPSPTRRRPSGAARR